MKDILILWDIDGTLMSCGADGTKALNQTFFELTGVENAVGEIKVGTAMDAMIVDRLMKHFQIPREKREEILDRFFQNLKEILQKDQNKRVLPGVREILSLLQKNPRFQMGLLTSNFKAGADMKLESVGLGGIFTMGGYGDIYGEKWHAARLVIEEAQRNLEKTYEKENIYLIGDTWYDIECARRLGIRSIAVATGWMGAEQLKEKNPDYFFYTLEDTRRFFDVIEGRVNPGI